MPVAIRMAALFLAGLMLGSPLARCGEPHWPDTLTIATASRGGTYHAYGEGLARILTRELKTTVWARPTDGPTENLKLLESGGAQLAFVTLGVAQQRWNGTGDWTNGDRYRDMRALFPMYDTPFQFVALRDAGVLSLADLAGKQVGIGPPGGTSDLYMPVVFKTLKLAAGFQTASWDELAERMGQGKLDALAVAAGVPVPSFAELERTRKIRYVALAPEQVVALRLAMPELGASVVAAGTYPSLLRHYQTVGMFNFAVARSDLPNDLVYAIVEAVFANHDELTQLHPAAAETVPANFTRNTFLPYHSGATDWYGKKAAAGVVRGD
jgi:uncharacterized protein